MSFFKKKPIIVEAIQLTRPEIYEYNVTKIFGFNVMYNENTDEYFILIPTLEGTMKASEGDWIIKGVSKEPYPCKPDIFEKTYEPIVKEESPDD